MNDKKKDGNLVFDVGLHRGEDAEFYLKKGFRVVAFEANPELIAFCAQRLRPFIDRGQLKIVQGAIVDSVTLESGNKKVSFYQNTSGSGWGTVHASWAERNERAGNGSRVIEVNTVDFSQALCEYGIPHYMKIDIEGCDTICVKALEGFVERPDYISIESDKTSFHNIRSEIELFYRLGYKSFQAVEQSAVGLQSPPMPAREGQYAAHSFINDASGLFGAELSDRWLSRQQILCLYRFIRIGYYLLGDEGILNRQFLGAGRLRAVARNFLGCVTRAAVPGWYDTHARLSSGLGRGR